MGEYSTLVSFLFCFGYDRSLSGKAMGLKSNGLRIALGGGHVLFELHYYTLLHDIFLFTCWAWAWTWTWDKVPDFEWL